MQAVGSVEGVTGAIVENADEKQFEVIGLGKQLLDWGKSCWIGNTVL